MTVVRSLLYAAIFYPATAILAVTGVIRLYSGAGRCSQ